jgi:hypothetical protein
MTNPQDHKECRRKTHRGERVIPVTEFYKDARKPDGLSPWCKACVYEYQTNRRDLMNKSRNKWREKKRKETEIKVDVQGKVREETTKYLEKLKAEGEMMVSMADAVPSGSLELYSNLKRDIFNNKWDTIFRPLITSIEIVEGLVDAQEAEDVHTPEQNVIIKTLVELIENKVAQVENNDLG